MTATKKRSRESDLLERLIIFSLFLSPILQTYGWGKYDFSFILTSVLSVIFLFKNKFRNTLPKVILYYFLYRLLIHEVSATDMASLIPLGIIKILLAYIMFFGIKDYEYFIKSYKTIAIVCIAFFYLQEITYALFGHRISGVIEQFPLALNVEDADYWYSQIGEGSRSSSFFSEPAMFVQFLLPLLSIELFSGKKNYFLAFIIGITILFTLSGNGMLGVLIVGVMYLYSIIKRSKGPKGVILASAVAAVIVVGGVVFASTEKGQEVMARSYQLSSNSMETNGAGMSGFIRIYRGFGVYAEFGTFQKIFGNDDPKYFTTQMMKSDVSKFFRENDTYVNTFQAFLILTGIVGVLFFILIFHYIWRRSDIAGRSIILTFFGLSFISGLYLTDTMALYLMLPLLRAKYLQKNNTKK